MYIAAIADNIADRKQTERLLGRANLALTPELGTLYIDAFGDETSLYPICIKYDMFLIDFDQEYDRSFQVAKHLIDLGAPGQIVIVKHKGDTSFDYPSDREFFELEKPISVAPLHDLIRRIHDIMAEQKKSQTLVEIRGQEETKYVPMDSILYGSFDEVTRVARFAFVDKEPMEFVGVLMDVTHTLEDLEGFTYLYKTTIVNTKYPIEKKNGHCIMYNGDVIKKPNIFSKLLNKKD